MRFNKFNTRIIKLWKPRKSSHLPSGIFEERVTKKGENSCVPRIEDAKIGEEQQTYLVGLRIVCPKCKYTGKYILAHEDGWQCLNCMKIIYRDQPLPIRHSKI
jgi:Zn ribbon nucleic-acid-binding protein